MQIQFCLELKFPLYRQDACKYEKNKTNKTQDKVNEQHLALIWLERLNKILRQLCRLHSCLPWSVHLSCPTYFVLSNFFFLSKYSTFVHQWPLYRSVFRSHYQENGRIKIYLMVQWQHNQLLHSYPFSWQLNSRLAKILIFRSVEYLKIQGR